MKYLALPALLSLGFSLSHPVAAQAAGFFEFSSTPTEVQLAYESFYRGNYEKMCDQIKTALMAYPNDLAIKQNLMELYDRALAVRGKVGINAGLKLPSSIKYMTVGIRKRLVLGRDVVKYQVTSAVDFMKGDELEQLRIVAFPNQVVLDKKGKVGEFDEMALGADQMSAYGSTIAGQEPAQEGLYLVDVKMKSGENTSGYFFVSKMTASDSPEVLNPLPDAEFSAGRPQFTWRDFVSKEYQSYEKRRLGIRVSTYETGDDLWAYNGEVIQNTKMEYGVPTEEYPQGVPPLSAGKYTFRVVYREKHVSGDLSLARESVTIVPFSVK